VFKRLRNSKRRIVKAISKSCLKEGVNFELIALMITPLDQ
jgi:hypothetical protein